MSVPAHDSDQGSDDERERLLRQYAEIATLAGGLAHEVRNPLSTIRLNLELLGEELEEIEDPRLHRSRKKLDRIRFECSHLEDILNAFLQFARAGQIDRTEIDLAEFLQEFVEFYRPQAAQHGIEVSPRLAAELPLVSGDRALLRQVLVNLALDAQAAMPDGGELSLQASPTPHGVRLEIIDTGRGMNEHARRNCFNVFFSTRTGGSGLGLPTVRKIIEAHGGSIECESETNRGTRFTILLPTPTAPE